MLIGGYSIRRHGIVKISMYRFNTITSKIPAVFSLLIKIDRLILESIWKGPRIEILKEKNPTRYYQISRPIIRLQ